jgi:hypothetical protein
MFAPCFGSIGRLGDVCRLATAIRALPLGACAALLCGAALGADHVIHISVDGLNAAHLKSVMDAGNAPTFKRLRDEGASTLNARTDFTHTNTLPNHTCMLTCRPVLQPDGLEKSVCHGWTFNDIPKRSSTLHNGDANANYVASVFDVAHDAGLSTALYAAKDKFVIYDQSYNETGGAPHARGRDKIDSYFVADDGPPAYSASLNERFLADMAKRHFQYVFLHYRDTDSTGHAQGWGGSAWRQAVKTIDGYLAGVLKLVETDRVLAGRTAIILTTDHGGLWFAHGDTSLAPNYTIPVLAWGAGVGRGDLYKINAKTRTDPGDSRPDYNSPAQPIRNGDTGNLALSLLGLGPIPGSFINADQVLRVALAGDYNYDGNVDAADAAVWKGTAGSTTDLRADGNGDGSVDDADHELWKAHFGESAVIGR